MKKETENFIKQISEIKNKLDLSLGEDLSIALMNLISLEEHFLFSFMKTSQDKYLEFLEQIRELRKRLLAKIVKKDDESEKWCISKHLLAASMRLSEVGTKYLHEGRKKEAEEAFYESFNLFSLFWAVNNAVKVKEKDKISESKLTKISQIIKKILDCCKE
jgi:ribosomal protein S15P/S13E